jgi:hypothetical protein
MDIILQKEIYYIAGKIMTQEIQLHDKQFLVISEKINETSKTQNKTMVSRLVPEKTKCKENEIVFLNTIILSRTICQG